MLKSELIAKLNAHDFDCEVCVENESDWQDFEITEVVWSADLHDCTIRFDDNGFITVSKVGKEAD